MEYIIFKIADPVKCRKELTDFDKTTIWSVFYIFKFSGRESKIFKPCIHFHTYRFIDLNLFIQPSDTSSITLNLREKSKPKKVESLVLQQKNSNANSVQKIFSRNNVLCNLPSSRFSVRAFLR